MIPIQSKKSDKVFYLKLLGTIAIFYIIFKQVNIRDISTIILNLDQWLVMLATFLAVAAIVLSAYKWQILLEARSWKLSIIALTKIYFVGLFMNNFLPSSIGGDVMRIYEVGKRINNHSEATASVVLERILATFGILLPALFALLPNKNMLGSVGNYTIYFFIGTTIFCLIFLKPTMLKPLTRIPWQWWKKGLFRLEEVYAVICSYKKSPTSLVKALVYSVCFQLLIILINYVILRAMGINFITLWQCTLVIPIISAVSMIPVSINGLGIREGSYVLLFANLGLAAHQAISLSLIFFTIVTFISLPGGAFFLMDRGKENYIVS